MLRGYLVEGRISLICLLTYRDADRLLCCAHSRSTAAAAAPPRHGNGTEWRCLNLHLLVPYVGGCCVVTVSRLAVLTGQCQSQLRMCSLFHAAYVWHYMFVVATWLFVPTDLAGVVASLSCRAPAVSRTEAPPQLTAHRCRADSNCAARIQVCSVLSEHLQYHIALC